MTALMTTHRRPIDATRRAAEAIQHRRNVKIQAMLYVIKHGVPGRPGELPTWPAPATVEAMDDEGWDALATLARLVDGVDHGTPSDATREQLVRIYRADYARHVMEQPDDPFAGLDDLVG